MEAQIYVCYIFDLIHRLFCSNDRNYCLPSLQYFLYSKMKNFKRHWKIFIYKNVQLWSSVAHFEGMYSCGKKISKKCYFLNACLFVFQKECTIRNRIFYYYIFDKNTIKNYFHLPTPFLINRFHFQIHSLQSFRASLLWKFTFQFVKMLLKVLSR